MPNKHKYRTVGAVKVHEFFVVGSGNFPLDMLRYDSCWPHSSDDLNKMMDSPEFYDNREEFFKTQRMMEMRGVREPSEDRWQSFGWAVFPNRTEAFKARIALSPPPPVPQPKIFPWKESSYQPNPDHKRFVVNCPLIRGETDRTTTDVFWSKSYNSYCLAIVMKTDATTPEWLERYCWKVNDDSGNYFQLLSINGAGEVRWSVAKDVLARILHRRSKGEMPGGDYAEFFAAAEHFGLDKLTTPAE